MGERGSGQHQSVECAIAELMEEGELQRHARRMRRIYMERRGVLVRALRQSLGKVLSFDIPSGGMALWATVARGIDVDRWAACARTCGVAVETGKSFSLKGRSTPHVRLGFAALNETELLSGVRALAAAL